MAKTALAKKRQTGLMRPTPIHVDVFLNSMQETYRASIVDQSTAALDYQAVALTRDLAMARQLVGELEMKLDAIAGILEDRR